MRTIIAFAAACLVASAQCFTGCATRPKDASAEAMLALPWQQFDQTPNSGFRVYEARHEYRAAADVIEVYLKQHQQLTVNWKIYALSRGVAEMAADVDRQLIRTGARLGENDNWIAGFCRHYREPVVSLDGAFDRVPDLRRLAY